MKLLLQRKIKGLGDVGDVVDIADGYGRNYLLPLRIALPNTPENRRQLQAKRLIAVQQEADRQELAKEASKTLKNALLQVRMKAQQDGTLYGSVNASIVADVIEKAKGYRIVERWIQIDEPLKKIGDYDVALKLPDSEITFKLTVLPEED